MSDPSIPTVSSIQGTSDPLEALAAATTKRNATINPANDAVAAAQPTRRRIPLSVPRRKLEIPPGTCPGYVLYFFLESNIPAALDGGYEFVDNGEVKLNQINPANNADDSGNTDLGSRVSILGNKANDEGKAERLVLMKIKHEWWLEDRKSIDDRNATVIQTVFGQGSILGSERASAQDRDLAYVKTAAFERGAPANRRGPILNVGLPKRA